ncbi:MULTISPECIES: MraY family glycosyltransferase [Bradyrhizobium]|uniref:UDP-N-acetylmuramyl pentapeptide phosphotransferase/UDP-N-acetylglucosamine-1-phosphate transferase n=2 Tax=Bradyrhizobium TaxID=374 RepID=A0ABY0Q9L7_9BRAD|nr:MULTISPECIES: glycosyltransferase family 4 protein [Bradyrhizobium]SDJ73649.1 UDP-N-acetylmuramyl pentapeptide phosphotransferase/UDP-N-acetylglucosamine-1-phosphate transferase [Bradyrhizobium ottawaense]SEC19202.1 UDP-N-acetylmuramyl pentapeptide phosphotransferase/UDP-N-acetylglucosamine-1-phosphate transferase [Bradyrhizobium lablabi]
MTHSEPYLSFAATILALLLSSAFTMAIRPLMLRHVVAKPNARSSHRTPTPQGAGIAVIAATLIVAGAVTALAGTSAMKIPAIVFAATLFIAAIGLADDVHSIPVLPRLLLQAASVAAIVFSAPENLRIVDAAPLWIERGLVLLAGLWFVNLVNFMDGLDLMTAAEAVPISAAIALLGWLGEVPASTTIVAAALCGALLGFTPFNRPVAKIFLGDVGSLPIGLLLGWCLAQLAWHQQLAACVLLPLYYLTDATLTLARRMIRHEPFWAAHRSHYYQRATDNGFTVWQVVSHVFALNVVLAALAIASTRLQSPVAVILLLAAGALAVVLTLYRFSRPK